MKKRFLAFALTLVVLCGSVVTPAFAATGSLANFKKTGTYSNQYSDIAKGPWYYDVVAAAYEYGLMLGSDGQFKPEGSITIAESLTLAARLRDIYYGGTGKFTQGNPWYQVYVDYALENGIIKEGQFSSYTAPAARKDFASILAAAFPESALTAINHVEKLPDVDKSAAYAPAVYRMYNAGILTGSDEYGTFNPDSTIKRSEVAAIIVRMADSSKRVALTLKEKMTAVEFLTNLARTQGEREQNLDGTYCYSVSVSQLTGLFQTDDGHDYLSTVVVREESDGELGIVIVDIHPDSTDDYPILYSTGVVIDPKMTTPYECAIEFIVGDQENVGTAKINPANFTEDTVVSFAEYEGDLSRKAELQEDLVQGLVNALMVLSEDYLTPYGYSLKDLGFNALAQQ